MIPIKKKTAVKNTASAVLANAKKNTTPVIKMVPPLKAAPSVSVSPAKASFRGDERKRMIEQAAYFIAEKAGFQGDPQEHWSIAEKQVEALDLPPLALPSSILGRPFV